MSGKKSSLGKNVDASSRASALPKNLIAPLPYRITRGGVPEAYCPFQRCTPEDGMEKTWKTAAQGLELERRETMCCVHAARVRSALYIVRVG